MSAASMPIPMFTENTWSASDSEPADVLRRLPVSLERLAMLLDENGEDDHGKIGPTQFAFKNALLLVGGAISLLGGDVSSSPAVDSQGGVRVTWRRGDKQVKLICPATPDAAVYIYQASPEGNSLRDRNVTAGVLANRLAWLVNRVPATAD